MSFWDYLFLAKISCYCLFVLVFPYYIVKRLFKVNLWQVLVWWFLNGKETRLLVPIILGFFFSGLMFYVPILAIVDNIYLWLFGDVQTLVYLGHKENHVGAYAALNNSGGVDFNTLLDVHVVYSKNFSFEPLYKVHQFIKDPGIESASARGEFLPLSNMFILLMFAVAALHPLLWVFHVLGYSVHKEHYPNSPISNMQERAAVNWHLAKIGLNDTKAILSFFVCIFLACLIALAFGDERVSERRMLGLPYEVRPMGAIEGTPISITKVERRVEQQDRYVDTGERDVVVRFDDGFNPSVFVSYRYSENEHPELFEIIKNKIENRQKQMFILDEDLELNLPE